MQFYGFEALNVQKYYFTHVYARGMKMHSLYSCLLATPIPPSIGMGEGEVSAL